MKPIRFAAVLLLLAALLTSCINPTHSTPPASSGDTSAPPQGVLPDPAKKLYEKSGRLTSDVSETLILWADWTAAVHDDDSVIVTVKVGIICWEISVGAKSDATVIVNGDLQTFDSPAIVYKLREKTSFTFAELTYVTELEEDGTLELDIRVTWPFAGTHEGVSIEKLTIKETILLPEGTVQEHVPQGKSEEE